MRYIWGLLVLTLSVFAQPREALLIGNYNYEHISVLDDTKPNIGRLEKVLKDLKFNVETEENLDSESLEESIDTFAKRLSRDRNTIGLLYYSGHGCQLNNRGYLLPIDVDSRKKRKIKYRALSIDEMLETLKESSNRLNMLFLDACRDVPTGTKGGTKGLVRLGSTPKGALVVYATESGKTADDNSNFIDALINNISKPNEQIVNVVADIADEVEKETKEAQIPVFFYKSLPKKFVLNKVHTQQPSIPKPSFVKNTDSKALQLCKAFSYSSRDTVGIMDKRTLRACKKVKSAMGKGFVARALYRKGNKDEAKKLFEQIKPSLLSKINADSAYLLGYLYNNVLQDVQKGMEYYTISCDLNNGSACNNLGFTYRDSQKNTEAIPFYKKGCDLNHGPSCTNLGFIYQQGKGAKKNTKKALSLYEKACNLDNPQGCSFLAFAIEKGIGINKDIDKAIEVYEKACNLNSSWANYALGSLYRDGIEVKKDINKALILFNQACDLGNPDGCTALGLLYSNGVQVKKSLFKKVMYYEKACSLNQASTCTHLGQMYEKGNDVKKDTQVALDFYRKACDLGDGWGCNNIATYYLTGDTVKKSTTNAIVFYKKACDLNNSRACDMLATIYKSYQDIPTDLNKALQLFTKACDLNHSSACVSLGLMYEKGKGTTKNIEKALKAYAKSSDLNNSEGYWREGHIYASDVKKEYKKAAKLFAKSCQLNDKKGCSELGELYYKEGKLPKDYKKAIKHYKKACNLGSSYGCIMVGFMYEHGKGVDIDKVKTKKYYKKSCKLGNTQACRYLNIDVKFSLTINTTPPDAKVQIMNIVPKYKNDMSLKKGLYKIKVSKESYETQKFDLELTENTVKAVKLQKVKHSMKNITIIGDKMWQDEVYTIKEKNAQALNIELGKARIWKSALAYCKNLKLGGYDDWRLPNKKDLNSITYKKTKIRNIAPFGYWASSTLDGYGYVSADNIHGIVDDEHWFNKNLVAFVRCIRSKQ